MKKLWLLCAGLIWPQLAIAAEAPFAPLPSVPDHVATVFVKLYHGPTFQELRTHHGGWTRVDESIDQPSYRSTSYFGPDALFVSFARGPSPQVEGYDWLHIMRGQAMADLIRWGDHPFKTGERRTLLGESCEIWNLSSRRLVRRDAKHLSCVTPDGIELWSRVENDALPGRSFETTAIDRRPVESGDVRPPRGRLDLKSWLTMPDGAARPSDSPGDVTIVMQNRSKDVPGSHIETRTVRRHYPWIATEDVDGKGWRRLRYVNEVERLDIVFESNAAGEPMRLSIEKALRDFARQKPPDAGRTETVLGELCFVSEERYRERGSSQCRTTDGVVLKEASHGHGLTESYDLVAVELDRSPVDLDAVLPPPAMFAGAAWGIPD